MGTPELPGVPFVVVGPTYPPTHLPTYILSPMPPTDLRYPIGRLERQSALSAAQRQTAIDSLASLPAALRAAVSGLTDAQLDTPYRDGGWTVRQLVHHVADSHLNAYTRFKLALTEESPTIRPYDQDAWSKLADSTLPVAVSLGILDGVHVRLVHLLRATPESEFSRTLVHPENGPMTLDALLSTYWWHGRHHTAHITALRDRMSWR
jgi:uncharacterized damage-inducible protein DinB